ncbi:MAG TPA: cytochrome c [Solirubrobacteraceae bacterium]|nr:cytochrome c [Solirubrobacteraceae bacterium]
MLIVAAGALGLASCGGSSGSGSASSGASGGSPVTKATTGRAVFQAAGCAQCHTLKAAGATGAVGPNLDALRPSAAKVRSQVERGGGVMPSFKDKLTAAQINAVANFVASSAGR